jgi:sulfofructose kinase
LSSADAGARTILCAGIVVLDEIFQVERFPQPETKAPALGFWTVSGGCAANAAVAVARLGGRAALAGPLGGPAGQDTNGDRVLAALVNEGIDCSGCRRLGGLSTPLSAIFVDGQGERAIVTHRDRRLDAARPADPSALVAGADVVLADNRFPEFVRPICAAARERSISVVLDVDGPMSMQDDLLRLATHVVCSSEGLLATTGIDDPGAALTRIAEATHSFLAVTRGARAVLWHDGSTLRESPVFAVDAIDTVGAGDVFHGAFALALAEAMDEVAAMRFAAAAAGLKCTRLGGSTAAPYRAEVEALLAAAKAE